MDRELHASLLSQYRRGCVFCSPHDALKLGKNAKFGACFDVAPLLPGHAIVYSLAHHGCAGEVPLDDFEELEELRNTVVERIRHTYGKVTLYEHGRAGHCLADGRQHRLCHHFHLHCVPGDIDVSTELASRFRRIELEAYRDITEVYAEHGDYLYVETDAGRRQYFVVDREIERHLLRTLVAQRLGAPQRADWSLYRDLPLLLQGMAELRAYEVRRNLSKLAALREEGTEICHVIGAAEPD